MPPFRRELDAAIAFVGLGWRRAAAERAALLGRLALYVLILAIFWQLWQATPFEELGATPLGAPQMLWYLAVTEWIVFAPGLPYRDVEEDIRSGGVATALSRPLPYAAAILATWAGGTFYHLLVIGAVGFATAWWLTGTIALAAGAGLALPVVGVLGCALILLFQLQLGYAAAWVGSAAPLFWIWQKLLFVLGGLLLPLALYPAPLRAIAEASPFAAILAAPASLALDASPAHVAAILALQFVWLTVLAGTAILVDRAATARFVERGV